MLVWSYTNLASGESNSAIQDTFAILFKGLEVSM